MYQHRNSDTNIHKKTDIFDADEEGSGFTGR